MGGRGRKGGDEGQIICNFAKQQGLPRLRKVHSNSGGFDPTEPDGSNVDCRSFFFLSIQPNWIKKIDLDLAQIEFELDRFTIFN